MRRWGWVTIKIYNNGREFDTALSEGGLESKIVVYKFFEFSSEACTHRPSLSLKNEISRNTVGVTEVVPGWKM